MAHSAPLHGALGARVIGKHVAVVGGGKTGAAVVRVLLREASRAARITVCDDAPRDKVVAGLQKHGVDVDVNAGVVDVNAGGLDAALIAGADLVVLSPGVPRAHPALQAALKTPGLVVNEIELAIALLGDPAGVRVLAITGTNGKSTTTTMAGAIAQVRDPQAFVGGNLGTPLCAAVVDGLAAGTPSAPRLLVLELSSYQLESLDHVRVDAAVVTNLTPDHLDRYDSVDAYYAAKARLFGLVPAGGGIGLNRADPESARFLVPRLPGGRTSCHFDISRDERNGEASGVAIDGDVLVVCGGAHDGARVALANPRIVGHHNRQNAAAAAALALMVGLRPDEIAQGLQNYGGIAHRLERVGTHHGVTWWNDSKATNVDAAVTALKSFASGVHLIAGGKGKGSPYAPLVDAGRGKVKAVYLIGEDAPALRAACAGVLPVVDCGTLDAACAAAAAAAADGDHIVLSPACASFDQFRDYGHRGERFRELFAAASRST